MLVLQEQKPVNMSNYAQSAPQTTCHGAGSSPQMIEKMTSKWLSLATTSILRQAPSARGIAVYRECLPIRLHRQVLVCSR